MEALRRAGRSPGDIAQGLATRPRRLNSAPADPRKKHRRRLVIAALTGSLLIGLVVLVILMINPPKNPTLIVVTPDAPDSTVVPMNPGKAKTTEHWNEFASDTKEKVSSDEPAPAAAEWYKAIGDSRGPLVLHFACPGPPTRAVPISGSCQRTLRIQARRNGSPSRRSSTG